MARQYLKNNHVTYYVITHVGVYAEQWYVLPSASTLSGGEYLDIPIEGNSIKNDGLNRLITVVTALTYPYKKTSPLFHMCYSEGDAAARARCVVGVTKLFALQTTRSDRNAQLRPVPGVWRGGGGGGMSASTLSK